MSVVPLGAAFFSASAAMRPPAPTLFSTMTGTPSRFLELVGEHARGDVRRSTRGEADDDANGALERGLRVHATSRCDAEHNGYNNANRRRKTHGSPETTTMRLLYLLRNVAASSPLRSIFPLRSRSWFAADSARRRVVRGRCDGMDRSQWGNRHRDIGMVVAPVAVGARCGGRQGAAPAQIAALRGGVATTGEDSTDPCSRIST